MMMSYIFSEFQIFMTRVDLLSVLLFNQANSVYTAIPSYIAGVKCILFIIIIISSFDSKYLMVHFVRFYRKSADSVSCKKVGP